MTLEAMYDHVVDSISVGLLSVQIFSIILCEFALALLPSNLRA